MVIGRKNLKNSNWIFSKTKAQDWKKFVGDAIFVKWFDRLRMRLMRNQDHHSTQLLLFFLIMVSTQNTIFYKTSLLLFISPHLDFAFDFRLEGLDFLGVPGIWHKDKADRKWVRISRPLSMGFTRFRFKSGLRLASDFETGSSAIKKSVTTHTRRKWLAQAN
jgi:hypothetical protein